MNVNYAVVFPGQGSQSIGMLADLAAHYPQVIDTFAEVSAVVGRDLWQLVCDGPATELDQTENTQPVMLAADVAVWRCWQAAGGGTPAPQALAGHSLGEYSALVCAEALTLPVAAQLVAERARLMQAAVPVGAGAMAAMIGLDDAQVTTLCAEQQALTGAIVAAVNFNAPGQVVIAGERAAVEQVLLTAKAAGAKRALLLPVSVPSHCALMQPAAEALRAALMNSPMQLPRLPVIHNVSVTAAATVDELRELLAQQIYCPVRWVETIQYFAQTGIQTVLEAGPGKTLVGLIKRIDKQLTLGALGELDGLNAAVGQ
ncbi:ACP S-malonyltransferase [Rhodoferax sp. 4810]|uniref:Malonyl CoA-acyl carrier protein transacylase n=1 Tax=Thiospirillum jenense TaxID=1653858 RepID=A0A839HF91_9GAMM|nr:ACP S-malonyltransferase [Thiospirillum jenense]MBB1076158.1 ACP S-malonyltransferase [Rhodoferax jenense]MBB1126056.1 ACP S-malonyltransferase [Thiospirillum jenense]